MPLQSFARTLSTLLTIVAFDLGSRVSAWLVPWLSQDGQSMWLPCLTGTPLRPLRRWEMSQLSVLTDFKSVVFLGDTIL